MKDVNNMKSRHLLTQIHVAELNDEQYSLVSQRYLQALGKKNNEK